VSPTVARPVPVSAFSDISGWWRSLAVPKDLGESATRGEKRSASDYSTPSFQTPMKRLAFDSDSLEIFEELSVLRIRENVVEGASESSCFLKLKAYVPKCSKDCIIGLCFQCTADDLGRMVEECELNAQKVPKSFRKFVKNPFSTLNDKNYTGDHGLENLDFNLSSEATKNEHCVPNTTHPSCNRTAGLCSKFKCCHDPPSLQK